MSRVHQVAAVGAGVASICLTAAAGSFVMSHMSRVAAQPPQQAAPAVQPNRSAVPVRDALPVAREPQVVAVSSPARAVPITHSAQPGRSIAPTAPVDPSEPPAQDLVGAAVPNMPNLSAASAVDSALADLAKFTPWPDITTTA